MPFGERIIFSNDLSAVGETRPFLSPTWMSNCSVVAMRCTWMTPGVFAFIANVVVSRPFVLPALAVFSPFLLAALVAALAAPAAAAAFAARSSAVGFGCSAVFAFAGPSLLSFTPGMVSVSPTRRCFTSFRWLASMIAFAVT